MSTDNKRILLRRAAGHIVLQAAQSTDFSAKCVNPSALLSLITVRRAGASVLFRALDWAEGVVMVVDGGPGQGVEGGGEGGRGLELGLRGGGRREAKESREGKERMAWGKGGVGVFQRDGGQKV